VQAATRRYPSPSDAFILLTPSRYRADELKESLAAPVPTSCSRISPAVDADTNSYYPLIQAMLVTAPVCPLSLRGASFSLLLFMSHILTEELTEPAAMNLDFGENTQQLTEEGSSAPV
jgi:hypothetical protein